MSDITTLMMAAAGAGEVTPADYQISRSLRFNSADSAYLSRTPASAGNRKTWTWSGWVKRSAISFGSAQSIFTAAESGSSNPRTDFHFFTDDTLRVEFNPTGSAWVSLITTQVFRDPSSFGHLIVAVDTTQATASNRVKVYWNGAQITTFGTEQYPNQNTDLPINNSWAHSIGRYQAGTSGYFNGYLTEIHFVDGQALTPSDFGETDATTGVWKPKAYAGTYGTNGFYLDFSDNSSTTTLGEDQAGSNDWTLNNFSVAAGAGNDSLVDTPTPYGTDTGAGGEVRGNYATLNALDIPSSTSLTNGNLVFTNSASTATWKTSVTTISVSSGKWYAEFTCAVTGIWIIGVIRSSWNANIADSRFWVDSLGYGYYSDDGQKYTNDSGSAYGATYTSNDVIGVALDLDAGTLAFYKNGVSQGTAFSGLSGEFKFACGNRNNTSQTIANFGQRPFAYTAPSGFKALCTQNLPDPTIVQGDDYFNTVLYTGNGATTQTITGVGFNPDLVWIKNRTVARDHNAYDAIRGDGKKLKPNQTEAETDVGGDFTFETDGFFVGNRTETNESGSAMVAWNWNAGGSNATNTDGTITSTVRANPTAGFSIVSYTGTGSAATVGHGLSAAPAMIIVKNRDQADAWQVYHQANTAAPETDYLVLNTTAATADAADRWNDTAPTSSVFSIGNGVEVNTNTEAYIAYVFAEVEGYSKFGSYTGNGSTDGPFVYANHRPAFIMVKRTDTTSNWTIIDTKREGYNVDNDPLYPNLNNAEGTTDLADILSNGFKLRSTDASVNASGGTYIFMSLASNPFKFSLAR